jgi:Na+-translocating ferredoxin:NAD+ oxidoreductase RNF subunit RnfB
MVINMIGIILPVAVVTVIAIFCGIMLTVADKFMAVPVDERVTRVRECLPGANCGACGFAGCDEYAEKLVNAGVATNLCTPGGADAAKAVSAVLGVAAADVAAKRAIVMCSGTTENTPYIMDYQGPQTCAANNYFYQGHKSCSHACLGYGDCVVVCQYDAIHVVNGVAVVDPERCTGCGMCAKRCPNSLINIVPATSEVFVGCHSTDKGAFVRKVCKAGCIGCMRCQKTCQYGAITINQNLASIDPEKCTNCGECIAVCPTSVIKRAACEEYMEIAQ